MEVDAAHGPIVLLEAVDDGPDAVVPAVAAGEGRERRRKGETRLWERGSPSVERRRGSRRAGGPGNAPPARLAARSQLLPARTPYSQPLYLQLYHAIVERGAHPGAHGVEGEPLHARRLGLELGQHGAGAL